MSVFIIIDLGCFGTCKTCQGGNDTDCLSCNNLTAENLTRHDPGSSGACTCKY